MRSARPFVLRLVRLRSASAERVGFEPTVHLLGVHPLSKRAPSTTRPSLLHPRVRPGAPGTPPGGGGGIRTPGAFAQRFSRPPPSTARPLLLGPRPRRVRTGNGPQSQVENRVEGVRAGLRGVMRRRRPARWIPPRPARPTRCTSSPCPGCGGRKPGTGSAPTARARAPGPRRRSTAGAPGGCAPSRRPAGGSRSARARCGRRRGPSR